MDAGLTAKLTEIFGTAAVQVAGELEPTYGAAVARLAWQELVNLDTMIAAKKTREAMDLLHSKMTGEELAAEKASVIGPRLVAIADSNAEAWSLARAILFGGFRVLLAALIPAVLL
jgi:sugar (pentulose or hexulose) kinase